MNIKVLKFIVTFMGVLILFGIIVLGFSIYIKFKGLSSVKESKQLTIEIPENMIFLDYKVIENDLHISYKSVDKILIKIYSLKTGKSLKEIEILK